MNIQRTESTRTTIVCVVCAAHLWPEDDAEVLAEHRSQCPDCRLFTDQVEITGGVLPGADPGTTPLDAVDDARSAPATSADTLSLPRLYRVAVALGVTDADELVQQTIVDALLEGATLDSRTLSARMTRAAAAERMDPIESLTGGDQDADGQDPDSEPAELFYPEFYEVGPDAGRFVDSPNDWGHVSRLAPEEELETVELYRLTDAVVDQLPEVGMGLLALVDVEGIPFTEAVADLGISQAQGAKELNAARIHVRGAIDRYLRSAEV